MLYTHSALTPDQREKVTHDDRYIASVASVASDKYLSLSMFNHTERKLANKFIPPISSINLDLNFMLNILPIPADLIGDLNSGMSSLTSYPFWLALLVNAILIPILEEVVFRGYLGKAMPAVVAAVISSVVFGLCHGGLVWAIWAGITGLIICVVRVKSGSIIPGMIFHIIMNTFGMIVSYFPVLEKLNNAGMYVLTAVGGILLAVYIVGILMDKGSSRNKAEVKVV